MAATVTTKLLSGTTDLAQQGKGGLSRPSFSCLFQERNGAANAIASVCYARIHALLWHGSNPVHVEAKGMILRRLNAAQLDCASMVDDSFPDGELEVDALSWTDSQ